MKIPDGPVNATGCGSYKWETCFASWTLILYISLGVGGGIVLILAIVIYCWCRRCSKRRYARYVAKVEAEEGVQASARRERSDVRRAERQARADEIRLKYNLLPPDSGRSLQSPVANA